MEHVRDTLGAEQTVAEFVADAVLAMDNGKAVGPDQLPAELLKLDLLYARTPLFCWRSIALLLASGGWGGGGVPR